MIRFHISSDWNGELGYAVAATGEDRLFVVNLATLAGQESWVREHLANQIAALADAPPPAALAEVIDFQTVKTDMEERRLALALAARGVQPCHESSSKMLATDR